MYYFDDEEFGRVYVSLKGGMRSITMRWKGDSLYMNAPMSVASEQIYSTLDKFRDKLRAERPKNVANYHLGQVIQCYGLTLTIAEQAQRSSLIVYEHSDDNVNVKVPPGFDFNTPDNKRWVSKALQQALDGHTKPLLDLAEQVINRVGVAPQGFEIGRGLHKLGHCTPGKVIQLSRSLMFLPEELIELTICHELAHLTHMNHSKQFHALVDHYLGGRERELEAKLKAFNWPVIR